MNASETETGRTVPEEFTVIVPVYNRAALISRCLDSIREQTYRPIHLIVVDNASTDDSASRIALWKEHNEEPGFRITVMREERRGAAAARNRGLTAAGEGVISFFDSDDTMRPELAECAMKAFADNPGADIAMWRTCLHTLKGTDFEMRWARSRFLTNHLYHAILKTQGYAVKRSFLRRAGDWDADLPVWNDWELGVRLLLNNPVIMPIDRVLVDVYSQKDSITGQSFSAKSGLWEKSLAKIDSDIDSLAPEALRERLHNITDYRRAILAAHYRREHRPDLVHALMNSLKERKDASLAARTAVRLAYLWTAAGLRGASRIADPFL